MSGFLKRTVIVGLLTNNQNASALDYAKSHQIPNFIIENDSDSDAIKAVIQQVQCDFILLAGYLKKIPDEIIRLFENRIINIHPSLLPSFGGKGMYGMHVHRAVHQRGCKVTGATVHFVNNHYDDGPILIQDTVLLKGQESPDLIAEKVLTIEHNLLVKAIKIIEDEAYSINQNKAVLRNDPSS